MKVKLSVVQEAKKVLLIKSHSYILTAKFEVTSHEKKIYEEHPLFQDTIFMSYQYTSREDDKIKYRVSDIYNGTSFNYKLKDVNDVFQLRKKIVEASEVFAANLKALDTLVGEEELEFGEE